MFSGAAIGAIAGSIILVCCISFCKHYCCQKRNQPDNLNPRQVWSVLSERVQGLPPCKETERKPPPYHIATQRNFTPHGLATLEGGASIVAAKDEALPNNMATQGNSPSYMATRETGAGF